VPKEQGHRLPARSTRVRKRKKERTAGDRHREEAEQPIRRRADMRQEEHRRRGDAADALFREMVRRADRDAAAALAQLPVANASRSVGEPSAAFPSWFLRITCDRCGKDRVLNETHTPQGGMHRARWILLTGIVAGTCGTTATARAAKIYEKCCLNFEASADVCTIAKPRSVSHVQSIPCLAFCAINGSVSSINIEPIRGNPMSGGNHGVVLTAAYNLILDMVHLCDFMTHIADAANPAQKQRLITDANRLIDRCDRAVNVLSSLRHARAPQLLQQWTLFYETFGRESAPGGRGQVRGCIGILRLCMRYLEEMRQQGH
jgi:hypothetical protein